MNQSLPSAATAASDALVRRSTVLVVVAVALGAAIVSYRHAYDLVHSHGESGVTALIVPGTVDGLIFAAGMVLLSAARRKVRAPRLAYAGLWLGIAATIGANVAHGLAHGPIGALVSAWPALALIISYELLMRMIRASRGDMVPAERDQPDTGPPPCPHRVADTALDAALTAYAHGRDCLGDEPSQRHLSTSFGVDRKKLAAALRDMALPPTEDAPEISPNGQPSEVG